MVRFARSRWCKPISTALAWDPTDILHSVTVATVMATLLGTLHENRAVGVAGFVLYRMVYGDAANRLPQRCTRR